MEIENEMKMSNGFCGREELEREINNLKFERDKYKNKCKEMALSFDSQINALKTVILL